LLWGRRRRESANCHLHIFEVGEINAIRSRAFVDRLAWRRRRREGQWFSRPPPEKVSSRSLPRGPSGKASNKRDLGRSLFLIGI